MTRILAIVACSMLSTCTLQPVLAQGGTPVWAAVLRTCPGDERPYTCKVRKGFVARRPASDFIRMPDRMPKEPNQ